MNKLLKDGLLSAFACKAGAIKGKVPSEKLIEECIVSFMTDLQEKQTQESNALLQALLEMVYLLSSLSPSLNKKNLGQMFFKSLEPHENYGGHNGETISKAYISFFSCPDISKYGHNPEESP